MNLVDPNGLEATVIVDDNNNVKIKICIMFVGDAATEQNKQMFKRQIEQKWSGKFDEFQVTTEVCLIEGVPNEPVNIITIDPHESRSNVGRGHNSGVWNPNQGANITAHEAGHLMGLIDRYTDKDGPDEGWAGNVMAPIIGSAKVEARNIREVIEVNR